MNMRLIKGSYKSRDTKRRSPNFGSWKGAISAASLAPGPSADPSDYLVLAAHRTKRPDISGPLSLTLVAGTSPTITTGQFVSSCAPSFILAAVWILSFGSLLVVYHCFKWRVSEKGKEGSSYNSRRICLILLIVLTSATA
ncbi:unnamed protein product [Eruca vesicaria subsp. sativa]|uniref:Uncharacterized protein n=1 Tax=Eruca vesicaria subsp. sativa TaxID=29727 RepID=A0ABC8L182_ERUVS|nr:unnamed protein product [Eruca vesicaria subsp. sativa]